VVYVIGKISARYEEGETSKANDEIRQSGTLVSDQIQNLQLRDELRQLAAALRVMH
jgi:hypothetical protein